MFILGVVGLFCHYHSQLIGWKLERLVLEITCCVSSGVLNPTYSHLLQDFMTRSQMGDVAKAENLKCQVQGRFRGGSSDPL